MRTLFTRAEVKVLEERARRGDPSTADSGAPRGSEPGSVRSRTCAGGRPRRSLATGLRARAVGKGLRSRIRPCSPSRDGRWRCWFEGKGGRLPPPEPVCAAPFASNAPAPLGRMRSIGSCKTRSLAQEE